MSSEEAVASNTAITQDPHDPDLVGLHLFQQALKLGSLEPFDHVARYLDREYMHLGPQMQGNALKAVTFGLAALAVYGWQETITERPPDGPLTIAGETLNYRFVDSPHFPPHDPTPIVSHKDAIGGIITKTQGNYALGVLENGLRASMSDYLSRDTQSVGGIPLTRILGDLEKHLVKGHAEELDTVADMYTRGKWRHMKDRSPYKFDDKGKVDVRAGITSTAGNSVRFCRVPVIALMRMTLEGTSSLEDPLSFFEPRTEHAAYDPDKTFKLLVRTVQDPIRAANRQDGTDIAIASEMSAFPKFHIEQGPHGKEVNWDRKHQRPFGPVVFSATGQPKGNGSYLDRQRCVATFKTTPGEVQPLQKIADAIIVYLHEHGLDTPKGFMAGKYFGVPEPLPTTEPWWRRRRHSRAKSPSGPPATPRFL